MPAGGPLLSYRQDASVGDWSVGDDVRCTWNVDGGVLVTPEQAGKAGRRGPC